MLLNLLHLSIAGAKIILYNSREESEAEVQPSEGALCRGGGGERPLSGWFLLVLLTDDGIGVQHRQHLLLCLS